MSALDFINELARLCDAGAIRECLERWQLRFSFAADDDGTVVVALIWSKVDKVMMVSRIDPQFTSIVSPRTARAAAACVIDRLVQQFCDSYEEALA